MRHASFTMEGCAVRRDGPVIEVLVVFRLSYGYGSTTVWHWRYPFFSIRNRRSVVDSCTDRIDRVQHLSKASFGPSTHPHLETDYRCLKFDRADTQYYYSDF